MRVPTNSPVVRPTSTASPAHDQRSGSLDAVHGDLLRRHAPTLVVDGRELFSPTAVDAYVEACTLVDHRGVEIGVPVVEQLDGRWSPGTHLRFIDDVDRRTLERDERRVARRQVSNTRLGRVGLVGRLVDALFQLSVRLRRTTPPHTTAAAVAKADRLDLEREKVCYARAVVSGEWLVLHYAYFYVMNDWRSTYRGLNDHEADWEQAWIFCDPADHSPQWIATSSHDQSGGDRRRHWSDPEVLVDGTHPVLYVGAGSHAMFYRPGDYVTRVDVPPLRWLLRIQHSLRRAMGSHAAASERGSGPALGVPFIDVTDADGPRIDAWDIRSMDAQRWIHDYRGLWGADRNDPLQGERGPSGPKFERSGELRRSWADPLGFAGLHGTPPPSAWASRVNRRKLDQVLSDLDERIRHSARLLPLAEQTDTRSEFAAESRRLTQLLVQRGELDDAGRRLERGEWVVGGVRDHLRHPAVPLERSHATNWMHAAWSAVSVPLLMTSLGAVLLLEPVRIDVTALVLALFVFPIEYLARGEFVATMRVVALEAVIVAFFVFVFGVVVAAGPYALGGLLLAGAVGLVFANANELRSVLVARRRR